MKYLFTEWDRIKGRFNHTFLLFFLDYDGTLAPIVKTPTEAVVSNKTKKLLKELSKLPNGKVAIISGRSLKDIKRTVGLKNIIYAGNHGFELEGPKISFRNPLSPNYRTVLEQIKNNLERKLSSIKGILLEDKGLSLSLHYRLVQRRKATLVKTIFHETVIHYLAKNKIKVKPGKMVLEVRPSLNWDKGKAVLWLLARQKFSLPKRKAVLPIYVGDDLTDEDAFRVLRNKGITVAVGKTYNSYAQYYLKSIKEVKEFLNRILGSKGTKINIGGNFL